MALAIGSQRGTLESPALATLNHLDAEGDPRVPRLDAGGYREAVGDPRVPRLDSVGLLAIKRQRGFLEAPA